MNKNARATFTKIRKPLGLGLAESAAEFFPDAAWQRCIVGPLEKSPAPDSVLVNDSRLAGARYARAQGTGSAGISFYETIVGHDKVQDRDVFAGWFAGLRDREARARITVRIRRLSLGNPGDVKPVGSGVSEMRIDYGPGYRVYFVRRGDTVVVLLCGGDKRNQDRDIARALELAREV